jgi:hypothetical protein
MTLDVSHQPSTGKSASLSPTPRARRIAATVKRALLMIVRVLEQEYGV